MGDRGWGGVSISTHEAEIHHPPRGRGGNYPWLGPYFSPPQSLDPAGVD